MVSSVQLNDLCDRYRLTPVFSRPHGRDYTVVSLNSPTNLSVDVQTAEHFKRWFDVADYLDVNRPWRPYIPGIFMDAPNNYRWLSLRLFDCEPHHLVTSTAPFCLTEDSTSTIPVANIGTICPSSLEPLKASLPPLPNKDIVKPYSDKNKLMVAVRNLGAQLLDIIGVCLYLSYRYQIPTSCSDAHQLLSWSKQPGVPLRGLVVELGSISLQELTDYLDHCVPVYYIYRDDQPSAFNPRILNAKDLDARQAEEATKFFSSRKREKHLARDERRSTQVAPPPGQMAKKIYMLQDSKGRRKYITKKQFAQLQDLYRPEYLKKPSGDVDILHIHRTDDDHHFDDAASSRDSMFVPQKPWKSNEPEADPSTVPDACIPPPRRRSLSVDDPDAPGWISPSPTHSLRPSHPSCERSHSPHRRPAQSSHRRSQSPRRDQASFRSRQRSPYVPQRHRSRSPYLTVTPLRGRSPSRHSIPHAGHRTLPDPNPEPELPPSVQPNDDTTISPLEDPRSDAQSALDTSIPQNDPALEWLLSQFPQDALFLPLPFQIQAPAGTLYTGHLQSPPPHGMSHSSMESPSSRSSVARLLTLSSSWWTRVPDPLSVTVIISLTAPPSFTRLIARHHNVEQQYISNIQILFSRPNSRRFFTSGGILWRVAVHYLSDHRVSPVEDRLISALSGPSSAASEVQPGLYDDEITSDEIAALIGLSTSGSTLWPPPEVFLQSDRWMGQWMPSNETWFQSHLQRINHSISNAFHTRRVWLKNLFQVRRQRAQNSAGSEGHSRVVCSDHDSLYSPFPPGRLTNFPL
ncbi:hypothetical protein J3R83DRAFT_10806 [Lanmaoa asiatica]|nr:hypothetical protein J3R83DRAFT_10806 [Lanmaoa asiatica]